MAKMTIHDLTSRIVDVERIIAELNGLCMAFQADSDAAKSIAGYAGIKGDPSYTANTAKNILAEYKTMLDGIARSTEIPWPPKVTIEDR